MKHTFLLSFLLFFSSLLFSQNKKPLDHADVHRWRKIEQQKLSNNGQWAVWAQTPVSEGDATLYLWNAASGATLVFPRSSEAQFSDDSKWLVFKIKPALDTLKALRRKKVKDEDLPKDTLGIYELANGKLEKIPRLKNFTIPEKWSGWLAFQVEMEKPVAAKKDTAAVKPDSSKVVNVAPPPPQGGEGGGEKITQKGRQGQWLSPHRAVSDKGFSRHHRLRQRIHFCQTRPTPPAAYHRKRRHLDLHGQPENAPKRDLSD